MNTKKILIVDDDEGILEVTKIILERIDYAVEVDNGKNVAAMVKTFKPNLVLLDLKMAGVDGRDVCRQLKKNNLTKHIPVIIMAADMRTDEKAQEAGANAFIRKPFDIEDLERLVKKHVS